MTSRSVRGCTAALVLLVAGAGPEASRLRGYEAALARRAAELRHRPAERKWEQIPWMTDLAAGREAARRENRPIFLWVAGDDPLGRC